MFAAMPPRNGIEPVTPRSAYHAIEAARAAAPHASIPCGSRPGTWTSQNESPPIEFMCGYTTAIVAAAAIIASTALPPSRRTASADWEASACGATAMPRVPRVGFSMLGSKRESEPGFYVGRQFAPRAGNQLCTQGSPATFHPPTVARCPVASLSPSKPSSTLIAFA